MERTSSNKNEPDERRSDRTGARKNGDEHEAARRRPIRHVGVDVADRKRGERAADPGKNARNDEFEMNEPIDRNAQEFQAYFVVPCRHRELAGNRVEKQRDQKGRGGREPEHQPEHAQG